MIPDLLNFINENGLKIMLNLKGWEYSSSAIIINNLAVVKPDFYPENHILAVGNYLKEHYTGVKNEYSPQLKNTIRYNSAYEIRKI